MLKLGNRWHGILVLDQVSFNFTLFYQQEGEGGDHQSYGVVAYREMQRFLKNEKTKTVLIPEQQIVGDLVGCGTRKWEAGKW